LNYSSIQNSNTIGNSLLAKGIQTSFQQEQFNRKQQVSSSIKYIVSLKTGVCYIYPNEHDTHKFACHTR